MKQSRKIMILFICALLLIACGGKDEPTATPEPTEAPTAMAEPTESPAKADTVVIDLQGTDMLRFDLDELEVEGGAEVILNFANSGGLEHNFVVVQGDVDTLAVTAEDAIDGIDTGFIPGGESKTISFTAPEPGMYQYVCTVPGHAAGGMVGLLTVTEP